MKQLGLIGYPLSHSFSKKYFTEKFEKEDISDAWHYALFPIESIEKLPEILRGYPNLVGLNVTIPYKEAIIPYLDSLDAEAAEIGAVNCVRIEEGHLRGYNTDVFGFEKSLRDLINAPSEAKESQNKSSTTPLKALVLGTGGAAKAVQYVLKKMSIPFQMVSRTAKDSILGYADVTADMLSAHALVINTTPLGMTPHTEGVPPLPYEGVGAGHFFYDLVYNPAETTFLKEGKTRGAKTENGLAMLYAQAEKGWLIWQ